MKVRAIARRPAKCRLFVFELLVSDSIDLNLTVIFLPMIIICICFAHRCDPIDLIFVHVEWPFLQSETFCIFYFSLYLSSFHLFEGNHIMISATLFLTENFR